MIQSILTDKIKRIAGPATKQLSSCNANKNAFETDSYEPFIQSS